MKRGDRQEVNLFGSDPACTAGGRIKWGDCIY